MKIVVSDGRAYVVVSGLYKWVKEKVVKWMNE